MNTNRDTLDDVNPQVNEFISKTRPELFDHDVQKALYVVERILAASDQELSSRAFLLQCFYDYGMPYMKPDFWHPWTKYMNESGFGALQIPTEFIDCLRRLMTLGIKSGVEVGVYRGGSAYFTAAVLQRAVPEFSLLMIDPWDSLIGFDRFSEKLNLRKAIPATSNDFAGQSFDYVFIDGDHTYEGAMRDFRNLGRFASTALAFHDIHDYSPEAGTVQAWNDIKLELYETDEITEIAHSVPRGLGIGLVIKEKRPLSVRRKIETSSQ